MIVITGATGNIGSRLARLLRAQEVETRLVGRDAKRLDPLVKLGAEAFIGDLADQAFLRQAFKDADAVFAMIPPAYGESDFRAYQNRVGGSLAGAIEQAGVPRVVNLSSQGADLPDKTGPILGLRDMEQRLDRLAGIEIVHLRPTYFMENLLMGIPVVKGFGFYGSPLNAGTPFSMIATRDIAAAAARLLTVRAPGSRIADLLGPRDYTMSEATAILGTAIGKPGLAYVQVPYGEALEGMKGMGLSPDMAGRMIEMVKSMNDGVFPKAGLRTPENSTPTTLQEFAPVFAAAFNA